tara:strand:+ start:1911 stop:3218 length:1308 start_codon:yes stop_codon:yes gene_type:complete
MASVKSLAKKPKKKVVRGAPRVKRGSKLSEPSWEGWEQWDGYKFHKFRQNTSAFYYENFKPVDLYPSVFLWMEKNDYSKEQVKQAKAAPAHALSVTAGINARMLMNGMPDTNPKHDEYWESCPGTIGDTVGKVSTFLISRIERAITEGKIILAEKAEVAEETSSVYVPTIQERIRDQAVQQSEGIEEWLDGFISNKKTFDPKGFDFKTHFSKMGVTQAHARKLKTFYANELDDFKDLDRMPTAGQLKKMSEHEQDMWAQLKEGYAHLKKSDIKMFTTAIDELMTALDFVIDSAKATRSPRKSKPKSATKLVEKLKYLKTDDKFKVASIMPDMIISASELWVFNTKTRKLGKYIAKNPDPTGQGRAGSGLSVKGTTIIGYDEKASIQKTLRKPADQLKDFKTAGKVKLRTFLDEIPTTDTMLNGRCNPDTILLKVS